MNTGKNEILEDVLKIATDDITEKLYSLLQGEKVVARIDQNVVYRSIAAVYKTEILSHLLQIGVITRTTANKIAESLFTNDHSKLQKAIGEYMDKSISFYDAGAEGFYHGLVLGLIALMDNQYKITSNRESGDERYIEVWNCFFRENGKCKNEQINKRMCKIKVDFCTSVFCMVNYRKTDSYLLLR